MSNLYQNDLIRLIRGIISTGLQNRGYGAIPVKQLNQPTQQGTNTGPTVYFTIIQNYQYGYMGASTQATNPDPTLIDIAETQHYETTFQINGLVIQDPANTNTFTALDLVS